MTFWFIVFGFTLPSFLLVWEDSSRGGVEETLRDAEQGCFSARINVTSIRRGHDWKESSGAASLECRTWLPSSRGGRNQRGRRDWADVGEQPSQTCSSRSKDLSQVSEEDLCCEGQNQVLGRTLDHLDSSSVRDLPLSLDHCSVLTQLDFTLEFSELTNFQVFTKVRSLLNKP